MTFCSEPGAAPPSAARPPVIATSWDDGHVSDLRLAELLERHGFSGTFFVPSRNAEGRAVMGPAEIVELAQRFEIGGHTRNHLCLTRMPARLAQQEIVANKHWLEDLLGREVPGFAYVQGCHNRAVRRLVEEAGFRYARTVKNLTDTPGPNRFAISTTVQFFPHAPSIYIRNYLRGGPTAQRLRVLRALRGERTLVSRLSKAAELCLRSGGYFHLWGHSWELDEYDLWGELDRFLGKLRTLKRDFAPVGPAPGFRRTMLVAAS